MKVLSIGHSHRALVAIGMAVALAASLPAGAFAASPPGFGTPSGGIYTAATARSTITTATTPVFTAGAGFTGQLSYGVATSLSGPTTWTACAVSGLTCTFTAVEPAGAYYVQLEDSTWAHFSNIVTLYVTADVLTLSPSTVTAAAGVGTSFVSLVNSSVVSSAHTTLAITAASGGVLIPGTATPYAVGSVVPGATCTGATCTATEVGIYQVIGTNFMDSDFGTLTSAAAALTVVPAVVASLSVAGIPTTIPTGLATPFTVTAEDQYGNTVTSFGDPLFLTSSDSSAVFSGVANWTAGVYSGELVQFVTVGTQSVSAQDIYTGMLGTESGIAVTSSALSASRYTPITPLRVLDTRYGNGHLGKLVANVPMTFQVTNATIPSGATAVTGILTVASPSNGWAVFLGPTAMAAPTTSTVNFVAGQTTSNGVTVALSSSGTLSATFISTAGSATDLVFDVTGYFMQGAGNYYHPVTPVRGIDTRFAAAAGNVLVNTVVMPLVANLPTCWTMSPLTGAALATAITGNVTVTDATSGWAIALGPTGATPTTSTLNFSGGQTMANGVTVALSSAGVMCATFISTAGNTADLVFDVTGYYNATATNGLSYYPMAPVRLVDSRSAIGLSAALPANTPRAFLVGGVMGISVSAMAITGNLTMTGQTSGWAAYLGNTSIAPSTSTINFSAGQVISNDVTVPLTPAKYLVATYISTAGNTTNVVLDVTGYFQ